MTKRPYKKALVILGPTTTGKTEVAFEVARRLDGEVINGDKFYLFSDFTLLTGLALPSNNSVPSHLYQVIGPSAESLSLVDYLFLVNPLIPQILKRDRLPIIGGCSYGYTRALLDLNKLSRKKIYGPFVGLRLPNDYDIASRVERRVDQLFVDGLIEEARNKVDKYRYSYPIRKGIIAVPTLELLDGKIDEITAKDKIKVGILSAYYSSLRKFLNVPGINWVEHVPEDLESTVLTIIDFVRRGN